MYEVSVGHMARGIAMSLFLGLVGGVVFGVLRYFLYDPFLYLIAFAGLGFMIGESTSIATNRKRGLALQYVAAGGVAVAYITFVIIAGGGFMAFVGAGVGIALAVGRLR